jgi:hypothetical protein
VTTRRECIDALDDIDVTSLTEARSLADAILLKHVDKRVANAYRSALRRALWKTDDARSAEKTGAAS